MHSNNGRLYYFLVKLERRMSTIIDVSNTLPGWCQFMVHPLQATGHTDANEVRK